jgi:hypothetical protein
LSIQSAISSKRKTLFNPLAPGLGRVSINDIKKGIASDISPTLIMAELPSPIIQKVEKK